MLNHIPYHGKPYIHMSFSHTLIYLAIIIHY